MSFDLPPVLSNMSRVRLRLQELSDCQTLDLATLTSASELLVTAFSELHPDYTRLAARLFLTGIHRSVTPSFSEWVIALTRKEQLRLSPKIAALVADNGGLFQDMINHERDFDIHYATARQFAATYLLSENGVLIERPQFMFLRISLAIHEDNFDLVGKTYELLSQQVLALPPALSLKAGTTNPLYPSSITCGFDVQSSETIERSLKEWRALWDAGIGIGAVFEPIERTSGSALMEIMHRIDAEAVEFTKAHGINPPATVIYLPIWHHSVLEFVTCRDIDEGTVQFVGTALLVPDVFMERLRNCGAWTLLNPVAASDLVSLCGGRLSARYHYLENNIEGSTQMSAQTLWKVVSEAQIKTSYPGAIFTCTMNRKNNQRHMGRLRCPDDSMTSLQFSRDSEKPGTLPLTLSLGRFVSDDRQFLFSELRSALKTTIRIAELLVDLISYPNESTTRLVQLTRVINIGLHGLADVYIALNIPYTSSEARVLGMRILETHYLALLNESCEMSDQLGLVGFWKGSPAYYGEHYVDMWPVETDPDNQYIILRVWIVRNGLRHSAMISLPPMRLFPSINAQEEAMDPHFSNIVTYSLPSCTFKEIRESLVRVLEERDLWTDDIARQIRVKRGCLKWIKGIPLSVKQVFKTSWELNPICLVEMASERAPFIDQSYLTSIAIPSEQLATRRLLQHCAWENGLKTALTFIEPPRMIARDRRFRSSSDE
ncbi:ribonucleotide reductase [Earliella scabrosa]|nr:ribonucleotide reductase [Earliella scabrosa]